MMIKDDIIDWKISQLIQINSEADGKEFGQKMPIQMTEFLSKHPELVDELNFIEKFWLNNEEEMIAPSAQMDANFYQMLSRAQVALSPELSKERVSAEKPAAQLKKPSEDDSTFLTKFIAWFSPQPLVQFAVLGVVFMLGFTLNQPLEQNTAENNLTSLQQEVSSLSTMLAISLLDKSSASERLSGVSYSRTSNLNNPILIEKLITLIKNDDSVSVRLAAINSLNDLASLEPYSETLLQLTTNESSVLVQIALCRLLLNNGSIDIKTRLKELLKSETLNSDVRDVLQADIARSFI